MEQWISLIVNLALGGTMLTIVIKISSTLSALLASYESSEESHAEARKQATKEREEIKERLNDHSSHLGFQDDIWQNENPEAWDRAIARWEKRHEQRKRLRSSQPDNS